MKPWLWLNPQLAHKIAPIATRALGAFFRPCESSGYTFKNVNFKSRLGVAGGVDKTGDCALAWQNLNAGFLEIGTITPLAQSPNPGTIVDRNKSEKSLWNKMGFPNEGMDQAHQKLKSMRHRINIPLLINCGKNRHTENFQAVDDYLKVMQKFSDLADGFVINISSPNTQGLRELQSADYLEKLLRPLVAFTSQLAKPPLVLLKLSPDMDSLTLKQVIETSYLCAVDGWVLTNTTNDPHLKKFLHDGGGVSGAPLTSLSRLTLKEVVHILGDRKKDKLLISAGGVLSAEEAQMRLSLGADLVQVYSALIFEGPFIFRKWKL